MRKIEPTLPPGFFGVEIGEPTVPKRKEEGDMGDLRSFRIGD
jgi:hypothetical protein